MAREINIMCDFIFGWIHTCLLTDTVDVELTIRTVKGIYTYYKDHPVQSTIFSPWSKSVFSFPSLRQKIQAFKDNNNIKQATMMWDNGMTPQFSTPQKPSQSPRKCVSDKIRTRWTRCNHQFNPIKTNRHNTLGMNLTDINKVDIAQPTPRRACGCFGIHAHTASMRPHIPLQYNQTGWAKIGMVKSPRQVGRSH